MLLISILSAFFGATTALGQSDSGSNLAARQVDIASSAAPAQPTKSRRVNLASTITSKSADTFNKATWGIDNLVVRETSSGVLLRFSYRITDANKAKALNDKKSTPYLIDQKTGAVLQVPTMPKVGMLRQTGDPENGLLYWMVFSNKGNLVKPGDRVDVVIGVFRAEGLVVQ